MEIKNSYLDLIKVFSIILISAYVISQAGYELNASHKLTYVLTRLFSNLGFPLLLMVFGAIVLKTKEHSFAVVKKCYRYLIPPFVLLNIVLGLLILYFDGTHSFATNMTASNWFIWIVLSCVLVIPILIEFLRLEKENGIRYILGLFILTSILWSLSVQFDFSMYYIDLVFFAEPLMFMVLGYYLDNKDFNLSKKKLIIISLVIFTAALSIRTLLITNSVNEWNSFFMLLFKNTTLQISIDPFTIVEVSALFILFKSADVFSDSSLVNFYSKISYLFLLILPIFSIIVINLPLDMSWIHLTVIGTIAMLIISGIMLYVFNICKNLFTNREVNS